MRTSLQLSKRSTLRNGHMLVSRGRQAAMSHISPEFLSLEVPASFLVSRFAPRMAESDSANTFFS